MTTVTDGAYSSAYSNAYSVSGVDEIPDEPKKKECFLKRLWKAVLKFLKWIF